MPEQRLRNFKSHEVIRVIQPAVAAFVLEIGPILSDQHHHGGAGGHLPLERLQPIGAAVDAAHIEKHAVRAECLVEQRLEMLRILQALDAPVVDENLARHEAMSSHPPNANCYNTI